MKGFLFLLLSFSVLISEAQKTGIAPAELQPVDMRITEADFSTVQIGELTVKNISAYLEKNIRNLSASGSSVKFLENTESKTGFHFLFQQTYNGIPVYRAQVKVNTDKKGNILSLFDNSYPVSFINNNDFPEEQMKNVFLSYLFNVEMFFSEKNYFINGANAIPVLKMEYVKNTSEYREVLLNKEGEIVYERDMANYYGEKKEQPKTQSATDSSVAVMVFLPDPLTTAGVVYGSPYTDSNDSDVPELNAERFTVTVTATYYSNNDSFRLENNYVSIKDFSSPSIAPVYSKTTPMFNYTRSQDGFEDVNAFYHISTMQTYLQSLGFNNLVNYSIETDTHANGGADNSMFLPQTKRLLFGEGCVDDAEDADVIIHEYGHAVAFSAAPNTNTGAQRTALDEANGDYFASSYSRYLNSYKWENVFSWDGHSLECWAGRSSISTKHYPDGLVNNLYGDADIWSSTIMQIWGDIGKYKTDETLIESIYSYATNMTMTQAAKLLLKADTTLHSGANYAAICNRLYNRGLISVCQASIATNTQTEKTSLFNSQGFANGEKATIKFDTAAHYLTVSIYDLLGKKLQETSLENQSSFDLNGSDFNSGVYFISIQGDANVTFKLVKY